VVKVVDAKVVQLDGHQYSVVRSFFESSLKDTYPWNTGTRLPMTHTVVFRKVGKWVLSINHYTALLSSDRVHGPGFPTGIWVILQYIHHNGRIIINTKGHEYLEVDDPYITYLDNPCGYPISLVELIDKMKIYIDAVMKTVPINALECNKYCYTRSTDC
jgi:hypothetical protein